MVSEKELAQFPVTELKCLRCDALMKDAGKLFLLEGAAPFSLTEMGDTNVRRVEFEVNICPNCGKTELFM